MIQLPDHSNATRLRASNYLRVRHAHALTLRPLVAVYHTALDATTVFATETLEMRLLVTTCYNARTATAVQLAPAMTLGCTCAASFLTP